MTDITQYAANLEAISIAEELFDEAKKYSGHDDIEGIYEYAQDHIHENVDGHEWVIYYHKAHQFCAAVDTDEGEEMLSDIGPSPRSYNEYATQLAFWTLTAMVNESLDTIRAMAEEAAEEEAGA